MWKFILMYLLIWVPNEANTTSLGENKLVSLQENFTPNSDVPSSPEPTTSVHSFPVKTIPIIKYNPKSLDMFENANIAGGESEANHSQRQETNKVSKIAHLSTVAPKTVIHRIMAPKIKYISPPFPAASTTIVDSFRVSLNVPQPAATNLTPTKELDAVQRTTKQTNFLTQSLMAEQLTTLSPFKASPRIGSTIEEFLSTGITTQFTPELSETGNATTDINLASVVVNCFLYKIFGHEFINVSQNELTYFNELTDMYLTENVTVSDLFMFLRSVVQNFMRHNLNIYRKNRSKMNSVDDLITLFQKILRYEFGNLDRFESVLKQMIADHKVKYGHYFQNYKIKTNRRMRLSTTPKTLNYMGIFSINKTEIAEDISGENRTETQNQSELVSDKNASSKNILNTTISATDMPDEKQSITKITELAKTSSDPSISVKIPNDFVNIKLKTNESNKNEISLMKDLPIDNDIAKSTNTILIPEAEILTNKPEISTLKLSLLNKTSSTDDSYTQTFQKSLEPLINNNRTLEGESKSKINKTQNSISDFEEKLDQTSETNINQNQSELTTQSILGLENATETLVVNSDTNKDEFFANKTDTRTLPNEAQRNLMPRITNTPTDETNQSQILTNVTESSRLGQVEGANENNAFSENSKGSRTFSDLPQKQKLQVTEIIQDTVDNTRLNKTNTVIYGRENPTEISKIVQNFSNRIFSDNTLLVHTNRTNEGTNELKQNQMLTPKFEAKTQHVQENISSYTRESDLNTPSRNGVLIADSSGMLTNTSKIEKTPSGTQITEYNSSPESNKITASSISTHLFGSKELTDKSLKVEFQRIEDGLASNNISRKILTNISGTNSPTENHMVQDISQIFDKYNRKLTNTSQTKQNKDTDLSDTQKKISPIIHKSGLSEYRNSPKISVNTYQTKNNFTTAISDVFSSSETVNRLLNNSVIQGSTKLTQPEIKEIQLEKKVIRDHFALDTNTTAMSEVDVSTNIPEIIQTTADFIESDKLRGNNTSTTSNHLSRIDQSNSKKLDDNVRNHPIHRYLEVQFENKKNLENMSRMAQNFSRMLQSSDSALEERSEFENNSNRNASFGNVPTGAKMSQHGKLNNSSVAIIKTVAARYFPHINSVEAISKEFLNQIQYVNIDQSDYTTLIRDKVSVSTPGSEFNAKTTTLMSTVPTLTDTRDETRSKRSMFERNEGENYKTLPQHIYFFTQKPTRFQYSLPNSRTTQETPDPTSRYAYGRLYFGPATEVSLSMLLPQVNQTSDESQLSAGRVRRYLNIQQMHLRTQDRQKLSQAFLEERASHFQQMINNMTRATRAKYRPRRTPRQPTRKERMRKLKRFVTKDKRRPIRKKGRKARSVDLSLALNYRPKRTSRRVSQEEIQENIAQAKPIKTFQKTKSVKKVIRTKNRKTRSLDLSLKLNNRSENRKSQLSSRRVRRYLNRQQMNRRIEEKKVSSQKALEEQGSLFQRVINNRIRRTQAKYRPKRASKRRNELKDKIRGALKEMDKLVKKRKKKIKEKLENIEEALKKRTRVKGKAKNRKTRSLDLSLKLNNRSENIKSQLSPRRVRRYLSNQEVLEEQGSHFQRVINNMTRATQAKYRPKRARKAKIVALQLKIISLKMEVRTLKAERLRLKIEDVMFEGAVERKSRSLGLSLKLNNRSENIKSQLSPRRVRRYLSSQEVLEEQGSHFQRITDNMTRATQAKYRPKRARKQKNKFKILALTRRINNLEREIKKLEKELRKLKIEDIMYEGVVERKSRSLDLSLKLNNRPENRRIQEKKVSSQKVLEEQGSHFQRVINNRIRTTQAKYRPKRAPKRARMKIELPKKFTEMMEKLAKEELKKQKLKEYLEGLKEALKKRPRVKGKAKDRKTRSLDLSLKLNNRSENRKSQPSPRRVRRYLSSQKVLEEQGSQHYNRIREMQAKSRSKRATRKIFENVSLMSIRTKKIETAKVEARQSRSLDLSSALNDRRAQKIYSNLYNHTYYKRYRRGVYTMKNDDVSDFPPIVTKESEKGKLSSDLPLIHPFFHDSSPLRELLNSKNLVMAAELARISFDNKTSGYGKLQCDGNYSSIINQTLSNLVSIISNISNNKFSTDKLPKIVSDQQGKSSILRRQRRKVEKLSSHIEGNKKYLEALKIYGQRKWPDKTKLFLQNSTNLGHEQTKHPSNNNSTKLNSSLLHQPELNRRNAKKELKIHLKKTEEGGKRRQMRSAELESDSESTEDQQSQRKFNFSRNVGRPSMLHKNRYLLYGQNATNPRFNRRVGRMHGDGLQKNRDIRQMNYNQYRRLFNQKPLNTQPSTNYLNKKVIPYHHDLINKFKQQKFRGNPMPMNYVSPNMHAGANRYSTYSVMNNPSGLIPNTNPYEFLANVRSNSRPIPNTQFDVQHFQNVRAPNELGNPPVVNLLPPGTLVSPEPKKEDVKEINEPKNFFLLPLIDPVALARVSDWSKVPEHYKKTESDYFQLYK